MNLKSWMIIALSVLFVIVQPTTVMAQSFDRGYQAFQKGNFKKARRYLKKGIKKTRDRYDKALMYKLLGISEYNLGRKSAASRNFKSAVKLDPAIRISKSETRNRKILSMFKSIKRKNKGRSRNRQSFRSARRGRSQAQRRVRSSGSQISLTTALLPFGIPQFIQGKPLIGAALAAGQAAGLAIFAERTTAANAADQEAFGIIQEQEADADAYDPNDFADYLDANEAFVLKAREEANQGLLLFAGVYAAGVIEALVNQPSGSSRRRRAAIEEEAIGSLAANEELESLYIAPASQKPQQGFNWTMIPTNSGFKGALTWNMDF